MRKPTSLAPITAIIEHDAHRHTNTKIDIYFAIYEGNIKYYHKIKSRTHKEKISK